MISGNDSTNVNRIITTTVDNKEVTAVSVSAALNNGGTNFIFNFNIPNPDVTKQNSADVQAQFNTVLDTIKQKMTDMGYPITIR